MTALVIVGLLILCGLMVKVVSEEMEERGKLERCVAKLNQERQAYSETGAEIDNLIAESLRQMRDAAERHREQ